ncbi:hypothetical protein F66182_1777 [Fusarium sp. NRRL 66182]|nr:hypothetical protein F66182_1777 [Fusarium sp. NRRL 66182]
MPQTILDVLVQPKPELDFSSVPGGQNTSSQYWIPVTAWRPWEDFTYQNLLSIYEKPLGASWRDPPSIDMASGFDRQVRDEQSMDYFLAKYIWPHVNAALEQATSILDWGDERFYLGPGSWCHCTGPPDWGLVSNYRVEQGKFWNLLPGDTKLFAKWRPDMIQSQIPGERRQWSLPLSQVGTYAVESGSRYGFIITDQSLVVLRFTKERIGEGLTSSRPSRGIEPQIHQRVASGETDVSSLMESMSLDSFGGQSYINHDLAHTELHPPEYAVIAMSAHGRGKLTVKLSIFCLCLMAARKGGIGDDDYPPLDSWSQVGRHVFIHNTSGFTASKLPSNATLFNSERPQSRDDESMSDGDAADSSIYQGSHEEEPLQVEHDRQEASLRHDESTISSADFKYVDTYPSKHRRRICFVTADGKEVTTKESQWWSTYVDYNDTMVPCWSCSNDSGQYYTWTLGTAELVGESSAGARQSEAKDKGKGKHRDKKGKGHKR